MIDPRLYGKHRETTDRIQNQMQNLNVGAVYNGKKYCFIENVQRPKILNILIIQRIFHIVMICLSSSYKERFEKSIKKLHQAESAYQKLLKLYPDEEEKQITALSEKIAHSALLLKETKQEKKNLEERHTALKSQEASLQKELESITDKLDNPIRLQKIQELNDFLISLPCSLEDIAAYQKMKETNPFAEKVKAFENLFNDKAFFFFDEILDRYTAFIRLHHETSEQTQQKEGLTFDLKIVQNSLNLIETSLIDGTDKINILEQTYQESKRTFDQQYRPLFEQFSQSVQSHAHELFDNSKGLTEDVLRFLDPLNDYHKWMSLRNIAKKMTYLKEISFPKSSQKPSITDLASTEDNLINIIKSLNKKPLTD